MCRTERKMIILSKRWTSVLACVLALFATACGVQTDAGVAAGSDAATTLTPLVTSTSQDELSTIEEFGGVVDAPYGGAVYATTWDGDLYAVDLDDATTQRLLKSTTEQAAFEVGTANRANDLLLLLADPKETLDTRLFEVTAQGLRPQEVGPSSRLLCLDNHAASGSALVHELQLGANENGSWLEPIPFNLDGSAASQPSIMLKQGFAACARWSSDRTMLARPALVPDDALSALTIVERSAGMLTMSEVGCSLAPSSFSPDDRQLAVVVICFGGQSPKSGLYLAPVHTSTDLIGVADMDLVAEGVFARTAWHPDGRWMAASLRSMAPRDLTLESLSDIDGTLAFIDTTNGEITTLDSVSNPENVVWLRDAVD